MNCSISGITGTPSSYSELSAIRPVFGRVPQHWGGKSGSGGYTTQHFCDGTVDNDCVCPAKWAVGIQSGLAIHEVTPYAHKEDTEIGREAMSELMWTKAAERVITSSTVAAAPVLSVPLPTLPYTKQAKCVIKLAWWHKLRHTT